MPKPSKRDQLVEATKDLLWEAGYEAMSPRDIQTEAQPGLVAFITTPGSSSRSASCARWGCWNAYGNKDFAETFILAIHGCIADEPSIKTLRSRSALIVDRFVSK